MLCAVGTPRPASICFTILRSGDAFLSPLLVVCICLSLARARSTAYVHHLYLILQTDHYHEANKPKRSRPMFSQAQPHPRTCSSASHHRRNKNLWIITLT